MVIGADEIVVDRLGDMESADRLPFGGGLFGDDAHGVGGIVAADVEKRVDLMRAQDLEDFLAIFAIGLVARRPERGGRRSRDRFQIAHALLAEVDEFVVDDAAHAVQGRRRRG